MLNYNLFPMNFCLLYLYLFIYYHFRCIYLPGLELASGKGAHLVTLENKRIKSFEICMKANLLQTLLH